MPPSASPATSPATVVLVHGSMHSSACWSMVTAELASRGVPTRTVDLPGRGSRLSVDPGVANDVRALHEELDGVGGPAVLCAHSAGGWVITVGGDHPNVRRLVYLAALMPAPGDRKTTDSERIFSAGGIVTPDCLIFDGDIVRIDHEVARKAFYGDCTEDVAAFALAQLVPERIVVPDDPAVAEENDLIPRAAWQTVPSTYVVCTQDLAVPPGLQRELARQASETVELPTSHSPFYSAPGALADVLEHLARAPG